MENEKKTKAQLIAELKSVKEAEQKHNTLLDNVSDMLTILDSEGKILYQSSSCIDVIGYRAEELLNKNIFDYIHPDDKEEIRNLLGQFVKSPYKIFKQEYRMKKAGGGWIFLESTGRNRLSDPVIKGLIINSRDVSERKLTEERIKSSELKFKTLFESANDSIFIMDGETFVDCNHKTTELFGADKENLINRSPWEFSPPAQPNGKSSKELAMVKINAALGGTPQFFEWKHKKLDGTLFDAEVSLNRLDLGDKRFLQAIVRDITERKTWESELSLQKSYFEQLFDNSPDGIILLDHEDRLIKVNKAFEEMFQYSAEEIIGKYLNDVIVPDNYLKEATDLSSRVLKNEIIHTETQRKRKDGKLVWVSILGYPIIRDKKWIGVYGIYSDISQRKEAEEELKKSEQQLKELNASKDKFFSIISHDLKNPFNSILGYSEFLMKDLDDLSNQEVRKFAENIFTSTKYLVKLLNNLLEWSRIQTGKIEYKPCQLKLREAVDEIIKILNGNAVKKNIELENKVEDKVSVYADPNMINSIMQNLISNAIKFTNSGGCVEVSSRRINGFVEMEIKDSGIGISKENLKKIFKIDQQFTTEGTAKEEGTGLGLILCKELIEKSGGRIWVKSEEGKGSSFYFTLPNR